MSAVILPALFFKRSFQVAKVIVFREVMKQVIKQLSAAAAVLQSCVDVQLRDCAANVGEPGRLRADRFGGDFRRRRFDQGLRQIPAYRFLELCAANRLGNVIRKSYVHVLLPHSGEGVSRQHYHRSFKVWRGLVAMELFKRQHAVHFGHHVIHQYQVVFLEHLSMHSLPLPAVSILMRVSLSRFAITSRFTGRSSTASIFASGASKL